MIAILVSLAAGAATHSIQIDHRGTPVRADYSARTDIQTRTAGAHTPNRVDGRRCMWTATLSVDRRLPHSPALARTIATDSTVSGSRPGPCTGNSQAIERDIAARAIFGPDHLAAIAARDRPALLAELDAMRDLASN